MKKFLFVAVILSFQILSAQKKQIGSSIVVQLNGIKAPTGQVLLSLFKSSDGFPTHPEKAFRWKRAKVTSSSLIISLDGLPLGTYAIAVVHDENSNEMMDRDWLGLPDEQYGISNNATGTINPPSFEEAKFTVTGKRDTIKIEMLP
ncbi:MAG: DUF2141 domain-containing protein [Bacteriovoracaceae bacterium]|nr:DUF2141 domain-containing protein [Bacteroidota bacterium]